MPSKNKSKDLAAALAKALERIDDLEIQVEMLKVQVAQLASKPDPWKPIGPGPNDPNPFRDQEYPRLPFPWERGPGVVPAPAKPTRPAPGRPYIGDGGPVIQRLVSLHVRSDGTDGSWAGD